MKFLLQREKKMGQKYKLVLAWTTISIYKICKRLLAKNMLFFFSEEELSFCLNKEEILSSSIFPQINVMASGGGGNNQKNYIKQHRRSLAGKHILFWLALFYQFK